MTDDTTDFVAIVSRLGDDRLHAYLFIACAIFAIPLLAMLWCDTSMFWSLSVAKILLLTGAIGTLSSFILVFAAVVMAADKRPPMNWNWFLVLPFMLSLLVQLNAIVVTKILGAGARLVSLSDHLDTFGFFAATTLAIAVLIDMFFYQTPKWKRLRAEHKVNLNE